MLPLLSLTVCIAAVCIELGGLALLLIKPFGIGIGVSATVECQPTLLCPDRGGSLGGPLVSGLTEKRVAWVVSLQQFPSNVERLALHHLV